ncbi:MAG TPA: DUF3072 domain-containing protein [Gemmatimonadaceae bacterium]|nr:DUF3072 domain-containing protein [Gemmatimonadaceae bacterium]
MAGNNRTKREHHTDRDSESNVKADANRDQSNTVKDPDEWTTGDERMTGAQQSYLKTLSEEAHEPFDPNLTKAEASKRIDELQEKTGRGQQSDASDER